MVLLLLVLAFVVFAHVQATSCINIALCHITTKFSVYSKFVASFYQYLIVSLLCIIIVDLNFVFQLSEHVPD